MIRRYRTPPMWSAVFVGLALGLLLQLLLISPELPADDFVEYWSAARLNLIGGNPYSAEQLLPLQRMAGRKTEALIMWNPPYTLALTMPLALAEYKASRLIWWLLNVIVVMLALNWWWLAIDTSPKLKWVAQAISFSFFPTIISLTIGQIGPFLLLGVTGFIRYERLRRDYLAGVFLALSAIKPHYLYLVWPAILLWTATTRRWRVIAGAAMTLLAATAVALVVNPQVFDQYLDLIRVDSPLIWKTPTFGTLLRLTFGWDQKWLQFLPMAAGLVWLAAAWRRRGSSWEWRAEIPILLLVCANTTAFGWSFDQVVLLPPVLNAAHAVLLGRQNCFGENRQSKHCWRVPLLGVCYIFLNVLAFVSLGRVSDLGRIWLAPSLLIWYVCTPKPPSQG